MRKLFYSLLAIWIIFIIFIFLGGEIKILGRKWMPNEGFRRPGDLYRLSLLDDYREDITAFDYQKETHNPNNAQALLIGDSFFMSTYGLPSMAEMIEKNYNIPVYYQAGLVDNPLDELKKWGYQKGKRKTLVLETVERYALSRSFKYTESDTSSSTTETFKEKWHKISKKIFSNDDLDYFFKNNILVKPINKWFRNLKFAWFGQIDKQTPLYSTKPKMLFYSNEVEQYLNTETAEEIKAGAQKVAELKKILNDKYNLDLVYIVIPNKLTIYSDYVADKIQPYDNFIPRWQEQLKNNGINFIDIYSKFKAYRQNSDQEKLYYAGDSHYTPFGKQMLLEDIGKKLRVERYESTNKK